MKKERLHALDSLRGFAALIVALVGHISILTGFTLTQMLIPFKADSDTVTVAGGGNQFGDFVVPLFFCISGFIFYRLYRVKIAERTIDLKTFSLLRLSRLYPLHIVTFILSALMCICFYDILYEHFQAFIDSGNIFSFILSILMIGNLFQGGEAAFNGPTWSLYYEILAYALFFALSYFIGRSAAGAQPERSRNRYIIIYLLPVLLGIIILQYPDLKLPLWNNLTASLLISFFMGCLCCAIHESLKTKKLKLICGFITIPIVAVSFVILLTPNHDRIFGNWLAVFELIVLPSILLAALNVNWLNKMLSLKPFRWLGDISYSMYLWHFPLYMIILTTYKFIGVSTRDNPVITYFITIVTVLVVSHCSHYYFEKPVMKKIRDLYNLRLKNRPEVS